MGDHLDATQTQELIRRALTGDDEEAWECVMTLQTRGTREVFDACTTLLASADPDERGLAADVLGQLGLPHRPFLTETIPLLMERLHLEFDADALATVIVALSHLGATQAEEPIARLFGHADPDVRYAVAFALGVDHPGPESLEALLRLAHDPVDHVRDWATFSLAQCDEDSDEIRQTLLDRSEDGDDDTRAEAVLGLARRKDERVLVPLIMALSGEGVGSIHVEAAGAFGDASLLPYLQALAGWWDEDPDLLAEATAACLPRQQELP